MNESETKIKTLNASLAISGKVIVPEELTKFNGFPYTQFSDLISDINSGKARLMRFSIVMNPNLFSLVASSADKFKNNLGLLFMYGGSVASIAAAYFFSWWLLLLIPVSFSVGSSLAKSSYNSAILKSSLSSELVFCFMYFNKQISIDIPDTEQHYFYNDQ